MTPSAVGQRIQIIPEFLDCTELSLAETYVVRDITFYADDQPTKLFLVDQPEAIYAAHWFEVIE